jgi:hypothetical protein
MTVFSCQDGNGFTDRGDQTSFYKHQNTSVQTAGRTARVKVLRPLLSSHQSVKEHQRRHERLCSIWHMHGGGKNASDTLVELLKT